MSAPDWAAATRIFDEVVDLPSSERDAAVRARCGGDAELESAVRELLAGDDRAESGRFLAARAPAPFAAGSIAAGLSGAQLGGFRLLRPLGQGGMGMVFEAEQENPRRKVAVKVLKPAFAAGAALKRFEVEAEILARLRHTNIAQVIASGVHRFEQGPFSFDLPWYAMELLDGATSVVQFASERRLDERARLELFRHVCDAVLHAHQRGVIHRDLKPGNVLVDASGTPKVIDFGIARATELEGTRESLATRAGDLLGTLRYMAPEQVDGRADQVDVRTDVYALGVVLFELLTGAAPIEVDESTLDEAVRKIRVEPPRRLRQTSPSSRRELEWIVSRALEKEPSRRYPSVAAFALDLERLDRGEPLLAGPPGLGYRAGLFARRHKVALSVCAIVVALLAGWIVTLMASIEESNANAARAEKEVEKATNVIGLLEFAIGRAAGDKQSGDVPIVKVFDEMEAAIPAHQYDPDVEAKLCLALGEFRMKAGDNERARKLLERSLQLLEKDGRLDSADALDAKATLARLEVMGGQLGVAESMLAQASKEPAERSSRRPSQDVAVAHDRLALLIAQAKPADAESLARAVVEQLTGEGRDPGDNLGVFQNWLARALGQLGRFEEAERAARDAVDTEVRLFPDAPARADNARLTLATILLDARRIDEAFRLALAACAGLEAQLGPTHQKVMSARAIAARARFAAGEREAALEEARAMLEQRVAIQGAAHPDLLGARSLFGWMLLEVGRPGDAEREFELALGEPAKELRPDHPEIARTRILLGRARAALGRRDEGISAMEEGLAALERELGPSHPRVAEARAWLDAAR